MRASVFLALFSLALFSSLGFAIARGGETLSSLLSGFRNYSNSNDADIRRHLSEGSKFQQSFGMTHDYMTNMELKQALNGIWKRCKDISRVYSIGESVDGVPLWVIEISNKPGEEEAKPAFKYIGNVHGDEPLGRELLVLLARWLCNNNKKDPLARFIVENVHLHILPSMNPDGFKLRKRGNANDIDLNRDFPDQFFPLNDDISSRQPETRAVIKWMQDIRFTASASLHGGALVANYPWDGTEDKKKNYFACPDDDTFRFLASIYSRSHYNMSTSKEFPGGITNGAAWYPIYGGMQDWNYIHAGCFEITLEISDNKLPSAKEIPTLWEYNKMSLLNLAASVAKTGVHGRVFSSDGGNPIPALITVNGIDYTTKAGRGFADYHRLLPPGERYKVTASMPGYKSKTTHISLGEEATSLDFILDPEVPTTKWSFRSFNECNCSVQIFAGIQSQVYIVLIIGLAFLCLLLLRKYKLGLLSYKHSPRRQVQV